MVIARDFFNSLPAWKGEFNDLMLDGVTDLLDHIDNPQNSIPTIHVAGTNGKGSVSCIAAALINGAGYSVGLFTSPHLVSIEERMVFDGTPISSSELDDVIFNLISKIDVKKGGITLFVVITALYFMLAKKKKVDFSIVEVGLGGRLDATNHILSPLVSVITSIALDHSDILGDTLEEIAFEKAGIIKYGRPVVVGEVTDSVYSVFSEQAALLSAPIYRFGQDFGIENRNSQVFYWEKGESFNILLNPSLSGEHQLHNSALAIRAVRLAQSDIKIHPLSLSGINFPGRLEQISFGSKVILLDAAHNVHGIQALTRFLGFNKYRDLTLIFGVLAEKGWEQMIDLIAPYINKWVLLSPPTERALDNSLIIKKLSCNHINNYVIADSASDALSITMSGENNILATGSMYMLGIIRENLISRNLIDQKSWWNQYE